MLRAKQLGTLSQCARTFIVSGSRCGSADGACTCAEDEYNSSGRQSRSTRFLHGKNKSILVSDVTQGSGSPKLKGAIEAVSHHLSENVGYPVSVSPVLSPRASFRAENLNYKRVVNIRVMTHIKVLFRRPRYLLSSYRKSSSWKHHRNTSINKARSNSVRLGASKSCSSVDYNGPKLEAKSDVAKAGQTVSMITPGISAQSGRSCTVTQDRRQQGTRSYHQISLDKNPSAGILEVKSDMIETFKTVNKRQNHAQPVKVKGERCAIGLYRHTLRQLKWGPAAEETLHKICYKLDPFQANQVLKLINDHTVAFGFFNWLKQQPGFKHDNHTYTTMVGILGRARQFGAIGELLEEMVRSGCEPNVVTYNRLIHGYGQANYIDEAINVFHQMQEAGCNPDRVTYCTLIDIHAKAGYLKEAMDLYRNMQQAGLTPDTFTYSVMINCLGKAGHLSLADKLFGEMVRQGCVPNLVTYNIMIALHAKARNHPSALKLYRSMRAAGFRPDKITYCIVMEILGHCGHLGEAEALFMEMKQDFVPDEPAYGLLVDMCGKAGDADKAWAWYQSMLSAGLRPNVPTCNSLLSAFLRACRFSEARDVLQSMLELGLDPSLQTYTLLLSCCMETKSHKTHCCELMAITGHPAHRFLLSLPSAEPGGQNVRDHASAFLDIMHSEDRESKRDLWTLLLTFFISGCEEECLPGCSKEKRSSYWLINLHVMSDGTAIIALSRTMAWFRSQMLASGVGPRRIDIITGWGRRSRVTGASLVRQSVWELLHLFRFPFSTENGNSGCFVGCGEALESWLLNSYVERMHLL
ncbi:unnamed protein product [Spirodela intermedia]|uniref:Smr domain-containing protein n=1 Tax=Spirodela intermedia TaxID=51605 RepID=A0A7I8IPU4_SPIIN|nr:unnamed protein product [Spirodela intermedia]CAA6659021.1 unnamed protein product [Spirodela intermedia]